MASQIDDFVYLQLLYYLMEKQINPWLNFESNSEI